MADPFWALVRNGAAIRLDADIGLAVSQCGRARLPFVAMLPCAGSDPVDIAHSNHVYRDALMVISIGRGSSWRAGGAREDEDEEV
jgi:hypothetical protein